MNHQGHEVINLDNGAACITCEVSHETCEPMTCDYCYNVTGTEMNELLMKGGELN